MPLKDQLPKDLIENPSIKNFAEKEVADLATAFIETKSLVGKSIQKPTGPEDQQGWEKVYDSLGHPKAAAEYGELEGDFLKGAAEIAAKNRMTVKALKDLIDYVNQSQKAALESRKQELAKEWGAEFDKNREIARRGVDKMDATMRQAYDALSRYDETAAQKFAFAHGKANMDNPVQSNLPPGITPQAAAARYRELLPKLGKDRFAKEEAMNLLKYLGESNALHMVG